MNAWIAIILIAGTTGLVAYLATRRRGPRVTTIETRQEHKAPE